MVDERPRCEWFLSNRRIRELWNLHGPASRPNIFDIGPARGRIIGGELMLSNRIAPTKATCNILFD
jgi:hypothetical protein